MILCYLVMRAVCFHIKERHSAVRDVNFWDIGISLVASGREENVYFFLPHCLFALLLRR